MFEFTHQQTHEEQRLQKVTELESALKLLHDMFWIQSQSDEAWKGSLNCMVQVNCAIKDLFFVILIKLPIHLSSCGVQTCELG